MAQRSKRRTQQHIIDTEAEELLRSKLPKYWVVRNYRPDYGIDLAIELFEDPDPGDKNAPSDTLGEHLFVQLKGIRGPEVRTERVYARRNVEREPLHEDKREFLDIEVFKKSLKTPELVTVQRVGAGVPVLLIIADLARERCHFVCLNDYIDKILVPQHPSYTSTGSRTIKIPVRNEVASEELKLIPFQWYGKRPKLFAAFQKFHYQYRELKHSLGTTDFRRQAVHFARILEAYDFWDALGSWAIIGHYYRVLRNFLDTGQPQLIGKMLGFTQLESHPDSDVDVVRKELRDQEVLLLWNGLEILPRNYEEVCREWFLPTYLGQISSYP